VGCPVTRSVRLTRIQGRVLIVRTTSRSPTPRKTLWKLSSLFNLQEIGPIDWDQRLRPCVSRFRSGRRAARPNLKRTSSRHAAPATTPGFCLARHAQRSLEILLRVYLGLRNQAACKGCNPNVPENEERVSPPLRYITPRPCDERASHRARFEAVRSTRTIPYDKLTVTCGFWGRGGAHPGPLGPITPDVHNALKWRPL